MAWDFPEEILGLLQEQSKIQSEINKTKGIGEKKEERKKKKKQMVCDNPDLIVKCYRCLQVTGKTKGPDGSPSPGQGCLLRAAGSGSPGTAREGARFLPKSQFQIWELPTTVPWQHDGCSQCPCTERGGEEAAPFPCPGFLCFELLMLFFQLLF